MASEVFGNEPADKPLPFLGSGQSYGQLLLSTLSHTGFDDRKLLAAGARAKMTELLEYGRLNGLSQHMLLAVLAVEIAGSFGQSLMDFPTDDIASTSIGDRYSEGFRGLAEFLTMFHDAMLTEFVEQLSERDGTETP